MIFKSILSITLLLCLFDLSYGYTSVNPVWLTSNYMRAGNEDVIKVLTGQAIDPIYTFTFSSALPGVPNLAYGIKRYRGTVIIKKTQVPITWESSSSRFVVWTSQHRPSQCKSTLSVPPTYISSTYPTSPSTPPFPITQTVSTMFPSATAKLWYFLCYNLQVNITAKVTGTTSYTNVINYTQQSVGRKYTKFGTPVNGNKMLLYICALHIWATFRSTNAKTNITTYFPINLDVVYDIETESTYRLTATLSTNVMIAKLHFSQIVYNADDVESSKKYVIVYQLWKAETQGGFLAFPQEFVDNFIMGVTDFATIDGRCGFEYQWNYVTKDGQFGVEILQSKQVSGDCGFSKMTSTVFYMKTWQCPQSNPYFNLTTNQCQDLCGLYHYENTTVFQCQPCQFACTKCSNATTCLQCDASVDHRRLTTVKTKKICACSPGYFQDPRNSLNKVCLKCIANCVTCKTSTTCELCDEDKGYALDANKKCILCGYGCAACQTSGAQCTTCRQTFVYNQTSQKCQCQPGKYLDKPTISCLPCHQKCLTCSGPTQYQCLSCPTDQNRIPLPQANGFLRCICNPYNYMQPQDSSAICIKKSQQSCDYGYIYIKEDKKCVEICGDGKNFGQFQCDDGNRKDGDGCSKTCKVEQGFSCQVIEGLSTCSYVGAVDIVNAQAFKNPFGNTLLVKCELSPIKQFFYSLKWKQGLVLVGPKMSVIDAWMQKKWLTINITYFQDLTGKTLTIKYSSTLAKTSSPHRTLFSSVFDFDLTLRDYNLPIEPVNNLKPTYLEQQTYDNVKAIQRVSFVIGILTICFVGVAIFVKSVFGLWQIVLGLQVMFLSLGSVKSMNPILAGLTEFSFIKGFRSTKIYFESLVSPNQVIEPNISVLGYVTSFFGNMNIMLFLQLATILFTGALYLMSKKDLTMQFPFQFAKRQLMLLIVFNAMNLVFSCCIMSTPKVFEICLAIGFGLIMLVQVFHFLSSLKQYYFIDKTFNLQNTKIKHLLGIIILVRILQSIAIALLKHQTLMSTIALLILQGLWTIIFTIFRPYEKSLFNILSMLTEWSVTGFLTINLLVNMQIVSTQGMENILSIVQVSIYYLIVLFFFIGLFYAFFTDFCSKKKLETKIKLNDSSPRKSSHDEMEKQASPKRQKRKLQSDFYIQDIDDTDYTLGRSQEIKLFQNSNNRRKRSNKE